MSALIRAALGPVMLVITILLMFVAIANWRGPVHDYKDMFLYECKGDKLVKKEVKSGR